MSVLSWHNEVGSAAQLLGGEFDPVEQHERAVKMVLDHLDEYRSVYAACQAIGPKVGVGVESPRARRCRPRWMPPSARVPRMLSNNGSAILSGRTAGDFGIDFPEERYVENQWPEWHACSEPMILPVIVGGYENALRTTSHVLSGGISTARVYSGCLYLDETDNAPSAGSPQAAGDSVGLTLKPDLAPELVSTSGAQPIIPTSTHHAVEDQAVGLDLDHLTGLVVHETFHAVDHCAG